MLDSIVVITAGPDKKPFFLHKGLLLQSSPYFRAALEGGFKEADLQTSKSLLETVIGEGILTPRWIAVEWPEEDPTIVDMFKIWLYSETVDIAAVNSAIAWVQVGALRTSLLQLRGPLTP